MNSHVVVGVGNIYASEALFRARISPRRAARPADAAPRRRRSCGAIKSVLAEAIEIGGTTLRDYVNADGHARIFQRSGCSCTSGRSSRAGCARRPMKQFAQGQRSTYWCPICQR